MTFLFIQNEKNKNKKTLHFTVRRQSHGWVILRVDLTAKHVSEHIHGDGEYDGTVVLSRDVVEGLKVTELNCINVFFIYNQSINIVIHIIKDSKHIHSQLETFKPC